MSDVVGKLLLLARSDAGIEPLDFENVDVGGLLTELSQDFEALAQDKGLDFRLGPLEAMKVRGDRTKLRQLFLNVLDNALRYTPSGGSVTGSLERNEGKAVVSITDTGIGIPEEHLPFVFDRFYRVDKARTNAEGGTGLGLAIAQSIAKMHGGEIGVESQAGAGTTVRVTLPLSDTQSMPWTAPTPIGIIREGK
jgi:signal transduction histidine kinase